MTKCWKGQRRTIPAEPVEVTALRVRVKIKLLSFEASSYVAAAMGDGHLREAPATGYRVKGHESHFKALADDLYRERVLAARKMPPEEKFLAGEELFDYACSFTLAGIREQFPGITPEEQLRILSKRLMMKENLERSS
jgi:hypothetical protein